MRKLLLLVFLIGPAAPVLAADKVDFEAQAKVIAPFLDEQTFGIGHVDVSHLNVDKLAATMGELGKIDAEDLVKPKKEISDWLAAFTKAGAKEIYLVLSTKDLLSGNEPFFVIPLSEGANDEAIGKLLSTGPRMKSTTIGKAVVVGNESTLDRIREMKPSERPDLPKAFAAAGDTSAQFILLPSEDNRKVIDQLLPMLPKEIGGGSTKAFTHGVRWAALGVDGPPKLDAKLTIQAPDAGAAKDLHAAIVSLFKAVNDNKEFQKKFQGFDKLAVVLTPAVKEDQLTVAMDDKVIKEIVSPLVVRAREAALRMQSSNNLKQLALAMHNYHSTYNKFPSAFSVDKDDKPLLSWRVHILPYIEHEALYKEFHLDEPWDSEHNKKLIAQMPKVYQSSKKLPEALGVTTYLTPRAKETAFPGKDAIAIKDITDGTSNTILIVDADDDHALVWTKPDDLKIDSTKPHTGLGNRNDEGFLVAFADGSVHFLKKDISIKNLWAMFTIAGGEVVTLDE
ncbi:MAG TPA: DUF1559 domain-containing protein [Gemmataceae bacterium]|nr:DUF1559 domain-containing protein [Gemmataceae bacterium]